jgi:hypothetical protein
MLGGLFWRNNSFDMKKAYCHGFDLWIWHSCLLWSPKLDFSSGDLLFCLFLSFFFPPMIRSRFL